MKRRSFLLSLAAGLAICLAGVGESRAGSASLASLLGNSITIDGLTFTFISYSTSPIGSMPSAADVTVNWPISQGGGVGIQFQAGWAALPGTVTDFLITYSVSAAAPIIKDIYMAGNPNVVGGTGSASVTETLFDMNGNPIDQIAIFSNSPGATQLVASSVFAPTNYVLVTKDILMFGGTGVPTLSFLTQTFSVIPEPTSMALLGIGLSGLFTFRRLRRRVVAA
jgi:hypothetical protein